MIQYGQNSLKRPPRLSEYRGLTFWLGTYWRFHCIKNMRYVTLVSLLITARVNKRFVDAVSSSLTVFNATTDKEWVQVYRGIATGLGKEDVNIEKYVEDGKHTVAMFEKSFAAFQNNDVFGGLELFGTALMDIVKAFQDCGETAIAKAIEKLAMDFVKCVKGKKRVCALKCYYRRSYFVVASCKKRHSD